MAKQRRLELKHALPYMPKEQLFTSSWGLTPHSDELSRNKLEDNYAYFGDILSKQKWLGIVYFDWFEAHFEENILLVSGSSAWKFSTQSRIPLEKQNLSKLALQVTSLGNTCQRVYNILESSGLHSLSYSFYGYATWLSEALALYHQNLIETEARLSYGMTRISPGFENAPELSVQADIFSLLQITPNSDIQLTTEMTMLPEQSTSSILLP